MMIVCNTWNGEVSVYSQKYNILFVSLDIL